MTNVKEVRKQMTNGDYAAYIPALTHCGEVLTFWPTTNGDGDAFWPTKNFPDFSKPSFVSCRIVIVGCQGSGKSTLFNRLTGSNSETSGGTETCTRVNNELPCIQPFKQVSIVDTPGMGSSEIHYDDAFQLREALIRKPVNMIALVASLPSNPRVAQIITSLVPMDKIMKSSTFMLDRYGLVNPDFKTSVLLILTHRDTFRTKLVEKHWRTYIAQIRSAYDWIGGVILIDLSVSERWLLSNIITIAACLEIRDYNIPMSEFCSRFPISRKLEPSEKLKIAKKKTEFNAGVQLALVELDKISAERNKSFSFFSSYVEKLGPSMDCLLRFLDDLYDRKSLEAVATLQKVKVEDLWIGTNEAVNKRRVEIWNACKSDMGTEYESAKSMVREHFPTRPTDAIYRKCNYCGAVFVKPTGCDFGTICGKSIGGDDSLPFTYDYDEATRSFDILEGQPMGRFETKAYDLRKRYTNMVKKYRKHFYGMRNSGPSVKEHNFEKGCGNTVQWKTMIPLTIEELETHNLIPQSVNYAVTSGPKKKTGKVKAETMHGMLQDVCNFLTIDDNLSLIEKINKAETVMGIDFQGSPIERVHNLYKLVLGKPFGY